MRRQRGDFSARRRRGDFVGGGSEGAWRRRGDFGARRRPGDFVDRRNSVSLIIATSSDDQTDRLREMIRLTKQLLQMIRLTDFFFPTSSDDQN